MKAEEAKNKVINFHLEKIFKEIDELASRGIYEKRFPDLTKEQVMLLEGLGYCVVEYSRSWNPLRHSCSVNWLSEPLTHKIY